MQRLWCILSNKRIRDTGHYEINVEELPYKTYTFFYVSDKKWKYRKTNNLSLKREQVP